MLYKASIDVTFYVVGPEGENELMLQGVLTALYDAVSLLLRHQVEKRAILENLDLVVLALDETIDNGSVNPTRPTCHHSLLDFTSHSAYTELILSRL